MMGKPKSRGKDSGSRNPERKSGKAWKKDKNKPTKVGTPERQAKDAHIRAERERKRNDGRASRELEKTVKDDAAKIAQEEENALLLAELQLGTLPRTLAHALSDARSLNDY